MGAWSDDEDDFDESSGSGDGGAVADSGSPDDESSKDYEIHNDLRETVIPVSSSSSYG